MKLKYFFAFVGFIIVGVISFQNKIRKEFFSNGAIKTSYLIVEGKIEGELTEYFTNGKVKSEIEFKKGKQHGKAKFYYNSGNFKKETYFINGVQEDTMKVYYENGNIQEISILKKGLKEGFFKEFYKNGNIKSQGLAKNNNRDGRWTYYFSNGDVSHYSYFLNGNLISTLKPRNGCFEYNNIKNKYSFSIPNEFEIFNEGQEFILFAIPNVRGEFKPSINGYVKNLDSNITFGEYIEVERNSIENIVSEFQLISQKHIKLQKHKGVLIEYLAKHDQIDSKIRVSTLFIPKNDKVVYILTLICTPDTYLNYHPAYKKTFNSFLFTL